MVNIGGLLAGAAGGASVAIVISAIDNFSGVFENVNKGMLAMGTAVTAFGVAGAGAIASVTKKAGEFEQTRTAFTTLLGSEEKALSTLKELTDFAAKTPFTIPGVEKGARMLLAVGFEAEELIPTLKSVGDVAGGLGLGEEGLTRLILNLGQVKTQGKLTGRELRDFAVSGVPLIDSLATEFGVTKEEISDMVSKGEIGFDSVMKAFNGMSGEGGKFFNLMEAQSKTFLGQMSNIEDSFIKIARTMGEEFLPIVKVVAQEMQKLIGFFQEHPVIAKWTAIILGLTTALALFIGPLLILVALLPALSAGFALLSGAMLPITLVIVGIAAAITGIILLIKNWDRVVNALTNTWIFFRNTTVKVWNSIVEIIEDSINKAINYINSFIKAVNAVVPERFQISLIPDIDLGGLKGTLKPYEKFLTREELATGMSVREDIPPVTNVFNINNLNGFNAKDIAEELQSELDKKIS